MGPLWADSGLQGYEDDIPFPWNDGYQYTPSTNDTIYISSSPQVDPTSCLEFGIALNYTSTEFYVFNQCENGNCPYFTFLNSSNQSCPVNTGIPSTQISQTMFNTYVNQSTGEATVLEEMMSDGLHVYLWDYSTSTWDDVLGFGVTGNNPTSGGMWLATEYYLQAGTCPSNVQYYAYVNQMNSGSGWTAASSAPYLGSSGPDSCLDWWPSGNTWTNPVFLQSPIYSMTGYSLQEPPCQPDSYGYCAVETSSGGTGSCYTYHYVNGQLYKVYESPSPTWEDWTIYSYSGTAGTATETITYSSPGCTASDSWSPGEPKNTSGGLG
jgi:hypothetical protein